MLRVLIKISGEFFSSNTGEKFNLDKLNILCENIINVLNSGIKVSLVIGGGNILRGRDFQNNKLIPRETADNVGMLATAINGIVFRDVLKSHNIDTELVSMLDLPFNILKLDSFTINNLINQNKVIIFVGGLGLPYFSTDTIAVVGAFLSKCDVILKATNTDGIYNKDPKKYQDAKYLKQITYDYAISNNLQIMDDTAFLLAKQQRIPIYIFSIEENNCFVNALNNQIKKSEVR